MAQRFVMTQVEVQGRYRLLRSWVALTIASAALLVTAYYVADRMDTPARPERSGPFLCGATVLVLVVSWGLSIQCLEVLVHPARWDGRKNAWISRVGVPVTVVCASLQLLALIWGAVNLWRSVGAAAEGAVTRPVFDGPQSVTLALVLVGFVGAYLAHRRLQLHVDEPLPRVARGRSAPAPAPADVGGELICCSGGGIRSASFCLGALQKLSETGRYHRAKAVFAVSGGSWIAAAFHALNRQLPPYAVHGASVPGLFALDSPELRVFRRDTRYLSSSGRQRMMLAYSFVVGLAVNVVLVLSEIRLVSWFIGWALAASNSVTAAAPSGASPNAYSATVKAQVAGSSLAVVPLTVILLSLLAFAAARVLDASRPFAGQTSQNPGGGLQRPRSRVRRRLAELGDEVASAAKVEPGQLRVALVNGLDRIALPLLVIGLLGLLIWPGIPVVGTLLVDKGGVSSLPLISGAVTFLRSLTSGGPAAFAAALSALVAIGGLVRSTVKGPATRSQTTVQAIFRFVRLQLAPWIASLLVIGGGYLLLAAWSVRYARNVAGFTSQPGVSGSMVVDLPILLATIAVLVLPLAASANFTTLYPFFRDTLAQAYLMQRTDDGGAESLDPRRLPTFSALAQYSGMAAGNGENGNGENRDGENRDGAPRVTPDLVLCATANVSDPKVVPSGRRATSFLFATDGIGMPDPYLPGGARRVEPPDYERGHRRDTSLAAAMAISGAAVAPVAGRESVNVTPYRLLMALANLRLGVWLKNPYWVYPPQGRSSRLQRFVRWVGDVKSSPGPGMILREGLGMTSLYSRYVYVTDGGHLDNLGLVEALRREPDSIIVLDASADAEDTFITLANAIATARMDLGIEVGGFDLKSVTRGDATDVAQGWTAGYAWYPKTDANPDGRVCRILYVKALWVEGATLDLAGYKSRNADFPLTGTTDQIYDEFDLEAFRQLGHFITTQALKQFPENETAPRVLDVRSDNGTAPAGSRAARATSVGQSQQ